MVEYRLSPAAEKDLALIWQYTREHWGVEQAHIYTDKLTQAFEALANTPQIAPACDYIRAGYRRQNIEQHFIYFRVMPYGIAVIRILHSRMDAIRHL